MARGQSFMCCVRNPRKTNVFVRVPSREDGVYPARRIGDRGDREIVYVPIVYVPFPAPRERSRFAEKLQKGALWGALFALDKLENPANLMRAECRPSAH